jgi:hypothetical protein
MPYSQLHCHTLIAIKLFEIRAKLFDLHNSFPEMTGIKISEQVLGQFIEIGFEYVCSYDGAKSSENASNSD